MNLKQKGGFPGDWYQVERDDSGEILHISKVKTFLITLINKLNNSITELNTTGSFVEESGPYTFTSSEGVTIQYRINNDTKEPVKFFIHGIEYMKDYDEIDDLIKNIKEKCNPSNAHDCLWNNTIDEYFENPATLPNFKFNFNFNFDPYNNNNKYDIQILKSQLLGRLFKIQEENEKYIRQNEKLKKERERIKSERERIEREKERIDKEDEEIMKQMQEDFFDRLEMRARNE